MRKKHTSRMMQPTSFSDFNPLDVLATAASLQRRSDDTGEDGENDGGKTASGSDKCEEEEGESKEGGEGEWGPDGCVQTGQSDVDITIDVVTEDRLETSESTQGVEPSVEQDADQQECGDHSCVADHDDSKGQGQRPVEQGSNPEPALAKKQTCVVQIVDRNGGKGPGDTRPVMTLRDATKLIVPTRQGTKALTVLKINKHQMTDHSYAFVCQLQNLKHEEDEGYSSRSSLDDEGEDCKAAAKAGQMHAPSPLSSPTLVAKRTDLDQSEMQPGLRQCGRPVSIKLPAGGILLKPPPAPTGPLGGEPARKATKIVIVSKDSKLQKIMAEKDSSTSVLMGTGTSDSSVKAGSTEMLRTLLRQKPKSVFGPIGANQVVVAGSLSDHVVNVLKSGRISLAPPTSSNNSSVTPQTGLVEERESERSVLLTSEPGDSAQCSSGVQSERQTVGSMADSIPVVGSCGDQDKVCKASSDGTAPMADSLTVTSESVEQASKCSSDTNVENDLRNSSLCDSSGDDLAGNKKGEGSEDVAATALSGDERQGSVDSPDESTAGREVQGFCGDPDKENSRESEEATTEDEASRDDSDVPMAVCSPNMDSQTALMSPVNERDAPMMSPIVGSMELCDLFKLPTMIKQLATDQIVKVPNYDVTVGCVVNKSAPNTNLELSVGDLDAEMDATPFTKELHDQQSVANQVGESILTSPKIDIKTSRESEESEVSVTVTKETPEDDREGTEKGIAEVLEVSGNKHDSKDVQIPPIKVAPAVPNSKLSSDDSCPLQGTVVTQHKIDIPVSDRPDTPEGDEDESRSVTPDLPGSTVLDPSSGAKNQYIIEDDESPVTKFGTPRSSAGEESPASNCSSPIALPIPTAPPSTNACSAENAVTVETPLRDKVKLLVTPESSQKSVFTAVRRPVVTGLNALPGNLQVVPVVPPNKSKGNIMHVVPVSCARIVPKSGQYVTGVPVLGGKTVVQVSEANKGRVSTLLVPLSVATNSSSGTPVSLVQGPKTKLINLRTDSSGRLSSTDSESARSPSTPRKDVSSPLVFHGRLTPLSSTTSENSESMSSPESSLQGGFSGVIMGRRTPDNVESTRSSLHSVESSPKDKINIRISANSVLESDDSMSSEPSFTTKKESIGIGTLGSLSWKSVESASSSKCLTVSDKCLVSSAKGGGSDFLRIQGGEVKRGIQLASEKNTSSKKADDQALPRKVGRPLKSAGTSANKALHAYSRKRRKLASESGMAAGAPPLVTQALYIPHVSQLHPLIDHDYCMFTEFNAQIQSSIIATTESKAKIEKKYAKKSKAVRTKAVRGVNQEEHIKASVKLAAEKAVTKGRRGRLKKRLLAKEKAVSEEDRSSEQTEDQQDKAEVSEPRPVKKQAVTEPRPSRTSERRARLQALKDNKNYVKITGSYQDEFVYFATKNKRCRPRKSADSDQADAQLTKQPQVGGMTVFDWYHDLAKADKTSRFGTPTGSRFGTPTASGASSPVPFSTSIADTSAPSSILPPVSTLATSGSDMSTSSKSTQGHQVTATPSFPPSAAPLHESEVADLVCDLSEINTLGSTIDNTAEKQLFSSLMLGGPELKTETVTTTAEEGSGGGVDMNLMAEQVRNMLNSMGEDELQMLGKELGSGSTGMADTSFDSFLSGFTPEAPTGISQPAASNNLCDLDEINDSDLLQSDITSMNVILGDLKESSGQAIKTQVSSGLKTSASAPALLLDVGEKLPGSDAVSLGGFTKTLDLGTVKLDKSELFPDMAPPPVDIPVTDTMAPELTVVSMYWNDLPGLMIRGDQYVRLVDIHKQVLPAKDTGILKKRCQMMGLPISNCTELQRDFLVRYANAAKSKSTVVVAKEAAQTLIGFYVEPKSRAPKQSSEDRSSTAPEPVQEDKVTVANKEPSDQEVVDKEVVQNETTSPAEIASPPATPVTPVLTMEKTSPERIPKSRTGGRGTSRKRRLIESNPESSPDSPVNGDLKRSARLRFKKVCYSDMLLGNHYDSPEKKEKDTEESPVAVNPAEDKVHQKVKEAVPVQDLKDSDESEVSDDHENKDIHRSLYPEDLEIRKLKLKMRKKSLNQVEKKRLRRLRDKVRKREIKRKLRERRKHAKLRNKQKTMGSSHMGGLSKSKRKLQETHVYTKKYNQEHCYAAAPEASQEDELRPETPEVASEDVPEEEGEEQSVAETKKEVTETPMTNQKPVEVPLQEPKEEPKEEALEKRQEVLNSETDACEQPPLRVLHRDSVHRVNQRGRWQDGALHLDRYQAADSDFIQCITCTEYFSLKRFMKHMHHQNNRDELAHVTLTQKLELSSPLPSEEETVLWNHFQKRRQELTTSGSKTKSEPRRRSASRITHKSNGRSREQLAVNTTLNNTVRESARNAVKNSTVKSVSPSAAKASKQTTPSSTRHSTRVRKRKQLHPIEKYVFSKLSPSAEQPSKRARLESESNKTEVETGRHSFEANGPHQGTPVRGVRLRLSASTSKLNVTKYDLRGGGGSAESETKRPTKVLGKRHRNSDTNITAMEDKVTDKTM